MWLLCPEQDQAFFGKEENNRNGCNVQEEITAEVEKRVERLVRLLHREVLRTVENAPNMSGIRLLNLSRNRFWNTFFDKSESSEGTSQSKEQKREGEVLRVHQGDCVRPLEGSNVAVFVTDAPW